MAERATLNEAECAEIRRKHYGVATLFDELLDTIDELRSELDPAVRTINRINLDADRLNDALIEAQAELTTLRAEQERKDVLAQQYFQEREEALAEIERLLAAIEIADAEDQKEREGTDDGPAALALARALGISMDEAHQSLRDSDE